MVMEARGKGVSANPFSVSVAHSHGPVQWFTCVKDISDEDRLKMIVFAQEELGKSYGRLKTIASDSRHSLATTWTNGTACGGKGNSSVRNT
jgi:hypothetical protein